MNCKQCRRREAEKNQKICEVCRLTNVHQDTLAKALNNLNDIWDKL